MHSPFIVAREYEKAIRLSIESRQERAGAALASRLTDALAALDGKEWGELSTIECSLADIALDSRAKLFVDVGELVNVDYGTGIHRVVRNLVREFALSEGPSRRCVPVALDEKGSLEPVEGFLSGKLGVRTSLPLGVYAPKVSDKLFLLDSNWQSPERFNAAIETMRSAGGQVYAMVYDLIPLRFPQHCVDFMPKVFERWLRFVAANCDGLICISRAVSDDLHAWISEAKVPHRSGLRIGHVHLGADIEDWKAGEVPIAATTGQAMEGGRSMLMVGTVEPRKRHDLALDAFERAWANGSDMRLVIAGKQGWNVEPLVRRIRTHPQYGQKLFWLDQASDADLVHAYRNTACLLQTSDAEGFGLPIVEAAHFGAPLLLSDIPVFREVAGEQARYFTAGDAASLAERLQEEGFARRHSVKLGITWAESACRLVELIEKGGWDHAEAG